MTFSSSITVSPSTGRSTPSRSWPGSCSATPPGTASTSRPSKESDIRDAMTGRDAIAQAESGEVVQFVYRAEGRRTEGSLARIGNGELRVR